MKKTTSIIFLLFPSLLFAQVHINLSKKQVIAFYHQTNAILSSETDSTLLFKDFHPDEDPVTLSYHFDDKGQCDKEIISAPSSTRLAGYLDRVLTVGTYHWNKINENQYISDFESKRMIELSPENSDHSFMILRMNWTKELYHLLTSN